MLRLITCLSLILNFCASARLWSDADSQFISKVRERNLKINEYGITSHEKYVFKSCQKHKDKHEYHYQVRCEDSKLKYDHDLESFGKDLGNISNKVLREESLRKIKKVTIQNLEDQKVQIAKTLKCLEAFKKSETSGRCSMAQESMIKSIREDLPKLRVAMSLMKSPGVKRRGEKQTLYNKRPKHLGVSTKAPPLTNKEMSKLDQSSKVINHTIEQAWFKRQHPKNRCIVKIAPDTFDFKRKSNNEVHECAKYQSKEKFRAKKKDLKKLRADYKSQYYKIIEHNPLLAQISLTGSESEEHIIDELKKVLRSSYDAVTESLKYSNSLKGSQREKLILNQNIINAILEKNSSPKVMCDIYQEIKDQADFDELTSDILLAGASVVGGGLCAFTAGLACVVGVAVVAEGSNIYINQARLDKRALAFNAGLSTLAQVEHAKEDRDLTLMLAPLALVGEGVGQGIKITRGLNNIDLTVQKNDLDFVGRYKKDNFRRKTSSNNKSVNNKEQFLANYEEFILTSERLNSRWINSAKANDSAFYLDIENSALKRLNDSIGDKSLVTALTNLHKDILSTKVNQMLRRYPEIDIEIYSDFKSMRYSFKPKEMPKELRQRLQKELSSVYKEASVEYEGEIKRILPDLKESPSTWFQAGLASSADEAGMTTKKARLRTGLGEIIHFEEVEPFISMDIEKISKITKTTLQKEKIKQQLTQPVAGTDKRVLSLQTIEIIRKLPEPDAKDVSDYTKKNKGVSQKVSHSIVQSKTLKDQLKNKLGVELSDQEALDILDYTKRLDGLTPGLWVKKRVNANLNNASLGGMSGDITAMGAKNIQQVGFDLINANTNNAKKAIAQTRTGEQTVTKEFDSIKNNFTKTVKKVLSQRGLKAITPCSGDDCVMIPTKELNYTDKSALVREFSNQENPSQYRLSFIPKDVPSKDRTNLAVHGELIEKKVRSLIGGVGLEKIRLEKLRKMAIATDMPGTKSDGQVNIFLGLGGVDLSKDELNLLNSALQKAIKEVNSDIVKDSPIIEGGYKAGKIDKIL